VQESAAVQLPDCEAIETSEAPGILPGPTKTKPMQQPQLLYCRWHMRFVAVRKHMHTCLHVTEAKLYTTAETHDS